MDNKTLEFFKNKAAIEYSDSEWNVLNRADQQLWSEKMVELYPVAKAAEPPQKPQPAGITRDEIQSMINHAVKQVVSSIARANARELKGLIARVEILEAHSETSANQADSLQAKQAELERRIAAFQSNVRRGHLQ